MKSKQLLLVLAWLAAAAASHGQGTIQFLNSPVTRHEILYFGGGTAQYLPIDLPVVYGIFMGTSRYSLSDVPAGPLATPRATVAGVMGGVPALYAPQVAGLSTAPAEVVFAQVRLWDAQFGNDWRAAMTSGRYYAETDIRQIEPLGPEMGPGTVIWQSRSGVSPNRFYPMVIGIIPEPRSVVLLALGGLVFGISRWRSRR